MFWRKTLLKLHFYFNLTSKSFQILANVRVGWHFISHNFNTNDVFGGGQVSEGSQHDIIDFVISSCPWWKMTSVKESVISLVSHSNPQAQVDLEEVWSCPSKDWVSKKWRWLKIYIKLAVVSKFIWFMLHSVACNKLLNSKCLMSTLHSFPYFPYFIFDTYSFVLF